MTERPQGLTPGQSTAVTYARAMDRTAVQLQVHAMTSAPALVLRPWHLADVPALVGVHQGDVLRRWISSPVDDEAGAVRWVGERQRGWEAGDCFSFAVVEAGDQETGGRLLGHAVLKRPVPDGPSAEVGYWTAAHARG